MIDIIMEDWLDEAYSAGTDGMDTAPGAPTGDPYQPNNMNPAASKDGDPSVSNMPPEDPMDNQDTGPYDDPKSPDMPDEKKSMDFEQWRKEFFKASIKGDVQEMKQMILDMRSRKLNSYQEEFLTDNLNILFLREQTNVDKASKEIKKSIKNSLDHNNPATTIVSYMTEVLETVPLLNPCFIKMKGLGWPKADAHRKFIGALTSSIKVGNGGATEDLIFAEKDYSIKISTRFNNKFGGIYLGDWSLRTDDPERYLKPPELQRLQDGSPEEKDVLRRRVVMESIATLFEERAFIITIVNTEGTVYNIGWDISTSLKAAYTEGRLVVRTNQDDGSEAMIDDDGAIISFVDLQIKYVKDTGETDEDGKPVKKELEFINRRTGQLYLTSTLNVLREASGTFPGLKIKETPYTGNPSDLQVLERCVPTIVDILMKQCG
jgi:hypothetical protein